MRSETTEPRCMLHLAPAGQPEDLQAAVLAAAEEMVMMFTPLARLDGGIATPNAPFVAGLEAPGGLTLNTEYFADFLAAIDGHYDPAATIALSGRDHWFVDVNGDAEISPIRYQYLMRRRSDFTHAQYCERYREVHAEFGIRTPGIVGYVQFHVDPAETEQLSSALGLIDHGVDSVSELYLESLDTFFSALAAEPDVGAEASEDEERFVDRQASQMYTSRVHHQGEFHEIELSADLG